LLAGVTATFGPLTWIWVSAACGLAVGLILGVTQFGFPAGFSNGLLYGLVVDLLIGSAGLLTRYFRSKGVAVWQDYNEVLKKSKDGNRIDPSREETDR
jgi:hypothetical protein